ncbi:MAG: hypothetical protein WA810_07715 [Maribacter sp.]
MKPFIILLSFCLIQYACKEQKVTYLKNHRSDILASGFKFPQQNFNIIGFGAYHGSSKTEDAELALLQSLMDQNVIDYYLPEADFSIAHYFNEFLQHGDTLLLKDLVMFYGIQVPQERTIEVYEKWKSLKKLNDQLAKDDKLQVVGIDIPVNYKYTSKHILKLLDTAQCKSKAIQEVIAMVKVDTTGFSLGDLSYADGILKNLVADYEHNPLEYKKHLKDTFQFNHIIKNLKYSFDSSTLFSRRDTTMYENYRALDSVYDFKNRPQFLRMGFSHIEKSREGAQGRPYFFNYLIENGFYPKEKVLSIIGYLTKSKVVWDELYDENDTYTGFTVEAGLGIGDYDKEYFRGIQNIKDAKLSDLTLFRLNAPNSPYSIKEPDLIEIIMEDQKSNGEAVQGMSTLDFLDYALLISNSKESRPIFELDKTE